MIVGLCTKCLFLMSDFNQHWNVLTDFVKLTNAKHLHNPAIGS